MPKSEKIAKNYVFYTHFQENHQKYLKNELFWAKNMLKVRLNTKKTEKLHIFMIILSHSHIKSTQELLPKL